LAGLKLREKRHTPNREIERSPTRLGGKRTSPKKEEAIKGKSFAGRV